MIWTIANRLLMGEMTGDISCFRLPRHHSFLLAVPSWFLLSHSQFMRFRLDCPHHLALGVSTWLRSGHQRIPCCWSWSLTHRCLTQARLMRIQEALLYCWGKDAYVVPKELNSGAQVALSMKRAYLKIKPPPGRTGPKGEWQCRDDIPENWSQHNALNLSGIWVILVLSVIWVRFWSLETTRILTDNTSHTSFQCIVKQACADIALPLCLPES